MSSHSKRHLIKFNLKSSLHNNKVVLLQQYSSIFILKLKCLILRYYSANKIEYSTQIIFLFKLVLLKLIVLSSNNSSSSIIFSRKNRCGPKQQNEDNDKENLNKKVTMTRITLKRINLTSRNLTRRTLIRAT